MTSLILNQIDKYRVLVGIAGVDYLPQIVNLSDEFLIFMSLKPSRIILVGTYDQQLISLIQKSCDSVVTCIEVPSSYCSLVTIYSQTGIVIDIQESIISIDLIVHGVVITDRTITNYLPFGLENFREVLKELIMQYATCTDGRSFNKSTLGQQLSHYQLDKILLEYCHLDGKQEISQGDRNNVKIMIDSIKGSFLEIPTWITKVLFELMFSLSTSSQFANLTTGQRLLKIFRVDLNSKNTPSQTLSRLIEISEECDLPQLIVDQLLGTQIDVRKQLLQNILFIGRGSLISGLKLRFKKELQDRLLEFSNKSLVQQNLSTLKDDVNIVSPKSLFINGQVRGDLAPYIGATILSRVYPGDKAVRSISPNTTIKNQRQNPFSYCKTINIKPLN